MTVKKRDMVEGLVKASFPEGWSWNRREKQAMRKEYMRSPKCELEQAYDYAFGILEGRDEEKEARAAKLARRKRK